MIFDFVRGKYLSVIIIVNAMVIIFRDGPNVFLRISRRDTVVTVTRTKDINVSTIECNTIIVYSTIFMYRYSVSTCTNTIAQRFDSRTEMWQYVLSPFPAPILWPEGQRRTILERKRISPTIITKKNRDVIIFKGRKHTRLGSVLPLPRRRETRNRRFDDKVFDDGPAHVPRSYT